MTGTNSRLFVSGSWLLLEQKLLAQIQEYKGDDPLRPAIVLVGSNLLAQYLEREIYPSLNEAGLGINVRFLLFPDLVDKLCEASLAQYRPEASDSLKLVVMKDILKKLDRKNYFSEVLEAPGLARAILAERRDFEDAMLVAGNFKKIDEIIAAAKGNEKFKGLFEIFKRLDSRLSDKDFEYGSQRFIYAADQARNFKTAFGTDTLFIYGFYDYTAIQEHLVSSLAKFNRLNLFMIETQDSFYSDYSRETSEFYEAGLKAERDLESSREVQSKGDLALFQAGLVSKPGRTAKADGTLSVVFAPGLEREAVEACREIMRLVRAGVKFEDIGVLVRDMSGYAQVFEEAFELFNIPYSVVSGKRISDFSSVRALMRMLRILDEEFSRPSVVRFLMGQALRPEIFGEHPEEISGLIDTVSREAFVVKTKDEWKERLHKYLGFLTRSLEDKQRREAEDDENGKNLEQTVAFMKRKIRATETLIRIVESLGLELEQLEAAESYSAQAEKIRGLAEKYIDFSADRLSESAASNETIADTQAALDQILDSLAELDRAGVRAEFKTLLELFNNAVASAGIRARRFRQGGVCLSELMAARGVQFRAIIIPGLSEGSFPLGISESPLLSDEDRSSINAHFDRGVRLSEKWRQTQEERLLFYLAVCQAKEFLVLTSPWLDLENNREKPASYLLVDALSKMLGGKVEFDKLRELAQEHKWIRAVELCDFAPGREELALSPDDFELLQLEHAPIKDAAHLLKDDSVRREVMLARERWIDSPPGFFSGNISGPAFSAGEFSLRKRKVSASALQKFLACPFKYFAESVLEIEELEDPARIWGFERLAQGNLIHRVMEKLFKSTESIQDLQDPQKYREKLREIMDKEGAQYLREEYPSPQAIIDIELDEIFFYLLKWREDLLPAKGFDKWDVEKSLGKTPVELDLMDGTSVRLSGRLDRIDRCGDKACVNDYKVSQSANKGTQQIQLPIYLFSACNLFGLPKENVDARFLIMLPERLSDVSFKKITGKRMDEHLAALRRVVKTVVDYIESGVFVPVMGSCDNCGFRLACFASTTAYKNRKHNPVAQALEELARETKFKEKDG